MKQHFRTFDALRFFACLKVFLLHLPVVAFPIFNFFKAGGGIGVILFFVLSGFLITYIILEEKSQTGKLNLYYFFIRRILRIWPLYFLMVGFAFITPYLLIILKLSSSPEGYTPNWWMSFTFLENYRMIFTHNHPNVSPLSVMWSLCIEEHFYILWGGTLFFINVKKLPLIIISSIILSNIANYIFLQNHIETDEILTNLIYFAFGAIPAYLLIEKKDFFSEFIFKIPNIIKILTIILIIIYVILSPHIKYLAREYIEPTIFGVLFCSLLCIIIPLNNKIQISDKNIFSKLGLYTYGFYLFHSIVLNLFLQIFRIIHLDLNKPLNAILYFLITLSMSLIISKLSYNYFESYFLGLKKHYYLNN